MANAQQVHLLTRGGGGQPLLRRPLESADLQPDLVAPAPGVASVDEGVEDGGWLQARHREARGGLRQVARQHFRAQVTGEQLQGEYLHQVGGE